MDPPELSTRNLAEGRPSRKCHKSATKTRIPAERDSFMLARTSRGVRVHPVKTSGSALVKNTLHDPPTIVIFTTQAVTKIVNSEIFRGRGKDGRAS